MAAIDRIEKLGRLVLWLTLAAACVIIPIEYGKRQAAEAQQAEAVRALEEKLEEAEQAKTGPDRLSLRSMGPIMRGLDQRDAKGDVWFTNVSPRSGIVCAIGTATNAETGQKAVSLATCQDVPAYGSLIHISLMFAGGDLREVCGDGDCNFTLSDAPNAETPAPEPAEDASAAAKAPSGK